MPEYLRINSRYCKQHLNDAFKYSLVLIDIPENAATMRASLPRGGGRTKASSQINNEFENIYRKSTKVVVMGLLRRIMRLLDQHDRGWITGRNSGLFTLG